MGKSLMDVITEMQPELRQKILGCEDVAELEAMKAYQKNNPNVLAVINARIERLLYFCSNE